MPDIRPNTGKHYRAATTPDGREKQLAALAYDLAEKQIREGTASSQVLSHFLKMGSEKEKLERRTMELQAELLSAKAEAIKSAKDVAGLYKTAMEAFQRYSGKEVSMIGDDDED